MYIDADTIIKAASLLGAIGALVAAIVSVYKVIESNKTPFRRSRRLSAMACAARCRGLWSRGATGRARMRWTN